ncbi:DUF3341 domain-containing protein [Akkermansia muciniphila]|nr:DUF3341 domain-containing protein [Akkermansia muciniphila]
MNRPAPSVPTADIPVEAMLAEVRKPLGPVWWSVFLASALLAAWGIGWSSWRIAAEGVGVLGVNNNVVWGLDIVHFVFWIGLGHAGTLISAVLLLTRQSWRSPIARGAEQMTLCAVICAAVFPVVHVGRVWMAWMASPLPEVSGIWPDMASPLMWDVMAVSTYFLLSLLYWYIGLVPDFALLRDCCKGRLRRRYGWLALGWQGTGRQWRAYEKASLLFAVILTPLVVSVHSVVSFDFSVTQVPGWHQSIFPPYFVGGGHPQRHGDGSADSAGGEASDGRQRRSPGRYSGHSGFKFPVCAGPESGDGSHVFVGASGSHSEWRLSGAVSGQKSCECRVPHRHGCRECGAAPVVLVPLSANQPLGDRRRGSGSACGHVDGTFLDCREFPEGIPAGCQHRRLFPQRDGFGHDGRERGAVYGPVHGAGACGSILLPVRRAGTAIPEQGGRGMKKPVISGWVLSFGSEKALLQAVRVLVKEENLRWEVCAPYPCAAVRLANRHAGKAVGAGVRLWAAAGGVCGFLAVALWLYWTQFCADPLVTQGRVQGWDSWPAYVPPLFEGTLLGAGLLTAAGFLKGALLPQWHDWAFECDFFRTDEHGNGYFILLEGGSEGHAAVLAEALHPDAREYVHGKGGRA